jgi:hypothetical protein
MNVLYCDDIRNEIGGKLSFMGVYNADIAFPSFPAALQKLCAYVTLKFKRESLPKQSVHIVFRNDEVTLAELKIDEKTLSGAKVPEPDPNVADVDRSLVMAFAFEITPLLVGKEGHLRARAYIDGEEIKGNALRLRAATPGELGQLQIAPQTTPPTK